jgi:hypothetical protein
MSGRKSGRDHAITVTGLMYYRRIRSDFLSFCHGLEETYCICLEKHKVKDEWHLHSFVRFKEPLNCVKVRELFLCFEISGSLDVQPCRSSRNWLKYITKEDEEPLFNCPVDRLSFSFRAKFWASNTPTFSYRDPFVLEHWNKYKFLEKLHLEERERERTGKPFKFGVVEKGYSGWHERLCNWFNRRISGDEWRGLYLYGNSGVGKSTAIDQIFGLGEACPYYMPVPGKFFCGDLDAYRHVCVIFEEFSFRNFEQNFSQIKVLLESKTFRCACNTAAYISNRTVKSGVDDKAPYELWYGREIGKLDHLLTYMYRNNFGRSSTTRLFSVLWTPSILIMHMFIHILYLCNKYTHFYIVLNIEIMYFTALICLCVR